MVDDGVGKGARAGVIQEAPRETVWSRLLRPFLRLPLAPAAPPGDEKSAVVFRAARNFIRYRLFMTVIGSGLFGLMVFLPLFIVWIGVLLSEKARGEFIFLLVLLALLAAYLLFVLVGFAAAYVDYENRYYIVTDRSLRIREGVFVIREMTVTFANIQNISVSQGPVQRALGLADLRVDTAGGGGATQQQQHTLMSLHTAWFRGVADAGRIRDVIQERLRLRRDSGLGDADDDAEDPGEKRGGLVDILRQLQEEAAALRKAARAAGM
ncbi:MAG TPA: PH domain-containing protein [Verrucomicrobiales bacterium]|nr:PH domain-containing protein [Verrucomicrobiales bacterium]